MNAGRTRIYAFNVLAAALVLAAFVVAPASPQGGLAAGATAGQGRPPENIFFTLKNAGNFKTLIKAVEAAGLVDTLKGAGPFTMFAPTDKAFAKLPPGALEDLLKPENKEKLRGILIHHVVPDKLLAADMAGRTEARTLKRISLRIDASSGVKVDDANVVQADVLASNGVIHHIDAVLIPGN